MEKINKEKFEELLKGDKTVVCDFYADWCGPCRMLAPVLDGVSEKFGDKAVFVKVNIDDESELAVRYGIVSIPFVGVFKGGELSEKSVGYMSKSEAEDFFGEKL